MMAATPNFPILLMSVFVMCVGGAFYSGTLDALVFDSLKEEGQEGTYAKKIANINTISLLSPAICGVIGGFMYKINPTLPFYANAFGYLIGLVTAFFLIEPHIDTERFSLKNFFKQSGQGLRELFKTADIKRQTILLLSVGFFVIISAEMVDGFLGFEFGFNEIQMGILWSVIYVICAIASQLTPFIRKTFKGNRSIIVVGLLMAVTFIVSPFIGLIVGGLTLALRSSLHSIFGNLYSIAINNNTESKYRATTLSTFNMMKNTPYVLTAYFIGSLSDKLSAKTIALYLGIALIIFILVQTIPFKRSSSI